MLIEIAVPCKSNKDLHIGTGEVQQVNAQAQQGICIIM